MDTALVKKIRKDLLDPAEHQRFIEALELLSAGRYPEDLVAAKTFTLSDVVFIASRCPQAAKLLKEARRMGNESRQILRENAADKRAIEGVKEPIFSVKGEHVGDKTVYSDSLLTTMLKANDPEKYAPDARMAQLGGGFVLNVNLGLVREPLKKTPKIIDAVIVDDKKELAPHGL